MGVDLDSASYLIVIGRIEIWIYDHPFLAPHQLFP